MAKYVAKIKDNYLKIKVKLSWGEELDEYQLDKMTEKKLHGFLKPEKIRRGVVEYSGPVAISLNEWLSKPIDRFGFYFMMAQIVNAVTKIQGNNLLLNKLVLDSRYVYINETTREVQFIYLPLTDDRARTDVMGFMARLCDSAKLGSSGDLDCVSDFYFFLRDLRTFDALQIWRTINRTEPKAIARLRRRNFGQSGTMSERLDLIGSMSRKIVADEDDIPTGLMDDEDDIPTGLMDDEDDIPTGLMDDEDDIPTGLLDDDSDIPTGLMDDEDDIPTGLLDDDNDIPTGLLDDDDDPPTGLLGEDEEPVGGYSGGLNHVSLRRLKTDEDVEIHRTMFRVGRSKDMDYAIRDNGKVSRNHLEIITRGRHVFAVDLNSTGGTYVNGKRLYPDVEEELHDGDRLLLANEEFIFSAY